MSDCGHRQVMPLSVRVYSCDQCGGVRDRDHHASLNMQQTAVGRHSVVLGTEKPRPESRGVVTRYNITTGEMHQVSAGRSVPGTRGFLKTQAAATAEPSRAQCQLG